MREKYEKYGADVFETHQLMEMLLFHSIKRRDTNDLAHRVLNKYPSGGFGSFAPSALEEVDGIGSVSANLIKLSCDVAGRALCEELCRCPMDSEFSIKAFLWIWYHNKHAHTVSIMLLDENNRFLDCIAVATGKSNCPEDYVAIILKKIEETGAKNLVLGHNHEFNVTSPSIEDVYLTCCLKRVLKREGYNLRGHYIVTGSDCISCPIE